jgi:hypothetical protein
MPYRQEMIMHMDFSEFFFCSVRKSVFIMVPFACIHCRTKRIKTNLIIEKGRKTEKKKEVSGDLKGPLAREPYGPPAPWLQFEFSTRESENIMMIKNIMKIKKHNDDNDKKI